MLTVQSVDLRGRCVHVFSRHRNICLQIQAQGGQQCRSTLRTELTMCNYVQVFLQKIPVYTYCCVCHTHTVTIILYFCKKQVHIPTSVCQSDNPPVLLVDIHAHTCRTGKRFLWGIYCLSTRGAALMQRPMLPSSAPVQAPDQAPSQSGPERAHRSRRWGIRVVVDSHENVDLYHGNTTLIPV